MKLWAMIIKMVVMLLLMMILLMAEVLMTMMKMMNMNTMVLLMIMETGRCEEKKPEHECLARGDDENSHAGGIAMPMVLRDKPEVAKVSLPLPIMS